MVVDFSDGAFFSRLQVNNHLHDTICEMSRTGFIVTFSNCPLLWVSKIQK